MKAISFLLIVIFFFSVFIVQAQEVERISLALPKMDPITLKPSGKFSFPAIFESSGLVKSRIYEDVYWTHNDSGDLPRIFPVRRNGSIIKPRITVAYNGIVIRDSRNEDWEDIAIDNRGNIYIGDIGNNTYDRKNFVIYVVREPSPFQPIPVQPDSKIPFYYPERKKNSSKRKNVNAEAIFWAQGQIYILTKRYKGKYTHLYCIESPFLNSPSAAVLKGSFDFKGKVTAADTSIDGSKLVVLTYKGIWLFEITDGSGDYFHGRISWLPIFAGQCEGICIDDGTLLISNENRKLFELSMDRLILVKE